MDFFDRQDASQRTTRYLVLLFGLAFVAVALATSFVVLLGVGIAGNNAPGVLVGEPRAVLVIAAAVVGVMLITSLARVAMLSRGGGHVARMLGGTEIRGDESDPLYRRLRNVVEEMAIASGLPVPEIYVLEQERGINAFAAGLSPADAAVAVTRGSLERLNRAELQGVVAHEFSHILNGDMRLNLRLMGFAFGILVLALLGRAMLRGSGRAVRIRVGRRGNGAGAVIAIALGLLVIGGIGVVLSRLIKAAVSRQREVLADASAVQFTREPLALAGALKKIGGFTPYIENAEVEEVSHMLFGRAGKGFTGLFATHPPLPVRIRALDPSFQPDDYIAADPVPAPDARDDAVGISQLGMQAAEISVEAAGSIAPAAGRALRAAIPPDLVDAAHSAQSAWLLVLALGLERGGGSAAERRIVESQLGGDRAARCFELGNAIGRLEAGLRLPLFELALPALRARPPDQIEYLFELLEKLAAADGRLDLFEYLLQRMLKAYFFPPRAGRSSAGRRHEAMRQLVATVAIEGHDNPESAQAAYAAGIGQLNLPAFDASAPLDYGRGKAFDPLALDSALDCLAGAPAREQRRALVAVAVTMRHDAQTTVEEAALFRTFAASLGCPIPPSTPMG